MPIVGKFCLQSIMTIMCYDKVGLWLSREFAKHDMKKMAERLNLGKVSEDIKTGIVTMSGTMKGMSLYIKPNGISVIGSLPKFLYDDNIHPLTRKTTREAITTLSESLGFDMGNALLTGLESGMNFPVSNPVSDYLSRLGELDRMLRYKFSASTLYYKPKGRKKPKVLCFYDKIADAKSKGMPIPVGFEDTNILKYELRLKGRLSHQLGVDNITASTLSERAFYKILIGLYQSYYRAIYKQKQTISDMSNIKTPNDALKYRLGRFLNEGEQGVIEEFINELKENETFADRKYYTIVKTKLKEAADMAGGGLEDELIKELDNDIENLGAYI